MGSLFWFSEKAAIQREAADFLERIKINLNIYFL